jgi:hypothetical protein
VEAAIMTLVDRTNHNRLAELAQQRASAIADRYIPAADRQVEPSDNAPRGGTNEPGDVPGAIAAATEQAVLLKVFIADSPVIQTAQEAQAAATWIESTRKTLAAMEDERKPLVEPHVAEQKRINGAYRVVREPLEELLNIVRARWNKWDTAERMKREAAAERARLEFQEANERAQAAVLAAEDAIAGAEVGECADVGSAVVEAQEAVRDANKLGRVAGRAERETAVRVASTLGGRAQTSHAFKVFTVIDIHAAINAMGPTPKILEAVISSARDFYAAHEEPPAGVTVTKERSI